MINIYARPSFIGNRFHRWSDKTQTQRVSSRVRGEEMAAFLGSKARLNPEPVEVNENDINIYVKPESLKDVGTGDYLDFLDGGHFEEELYSRPDIKVIVATENSYHTLREKFPNKMFFIPHHHINFERNKRNRHEISTCGYIGSYSLTSEKVYSRLGKQIEEKTGLNFYPFYEYKTRQDAVDFYMNIDILVIGDWHVEDINPHKVPTKIINAASFGVPSIAWPREGYREIADWYMGVFNPSQLISEIVYLKEHPLFYEDLAKKITEYSEQYHIENIAKLYEELEK